jgi:hypothetical protein
MRVDLIDGKYATFTEQWKAEDTRCSSCNKPLYSRWWWMTYRLNNLRNAARCARAGQWRGAWHWLRTFDARRFVKGI